MWSFLGKSYIVSGGLSGIGLNTTLRLATGGAHVWVADISTNTPAEIREHPASSNIHLSKTPVDIRSLEECRNLTEAVVKQHGRLDGLVNCAGICLAEPAIGSRELHEVFQKEFDINVRGTFNLGTEVLSLMQGQDVHSLAGRGSIVNIGSIAAQQGIAGLSVYCMSKHAILGLTRAWAQDWAAKQIRVNAVAPGKSCDFYWEIEDSG